LAWPWAAVVPGLAQHWRRAALEKQRSGLICISGASIGALVGAIYCAVNWMILEDFIRDLSWKDMLSYFEPCVFPSSGPAGWQQDLRPAFRTTSSGMRIEE